MSQTPQTIFEFKKFGIRQGRAAMKVGIDGVLLGSWANIDESARILDIGAGTGLLSLMCAQRNDKAIIEAVEKDSSSYLDLVQNISNCKWSERMVGYHCDIFDLLCQARIDYIICNPPFFQNGEQIKSVSRQMARSAIHMPLNRLFGFVNKHLSETGFFAMVYPYDKFDVVISNASLQGLFLKRCLILSPSSVGKKPIRCFLEFSRENSEEIEHKYLSIRDEEGEFTHEFKCLTKGFYLDF